MAQKSAQIRKSSQHSAKNPQKSALAPLRFAWPTMMNFPSAHGGEPHYLAQFPIDIDINIDIDIDIDIDYISSYENHKL